MVFITISSNKGPGEPVQMRRLPREFTACIHKYESRGRHRLKFRNPALLDTSVWEVKGGFCTYAIRTKVSKGAKIMNRYN